MPKRTHEYQSTIRFNVAQLNLVSRLMARTGLSLVSVVRLALASLADKLGEPVTLPRAGAVPKKQPGLGHEPAKPTIESGTTDSDPEGSHDF
jgi:hypothetical protein